MNVPVSEEQIHALAFYLWETDGSPEGRAQEYWQKARAQLATVGMLPGLQLANASV